MKGIWGRGVGEKGAGMLRARERCAGVIRIYVLGYVVCDFEHFAAYWNT
jgi:hypothetical protein